jgi:hypothetical protein
MPLDLYYICSKQETKAQRKNKNENQGRKYGGLTPSKSARNNFKPHNFVGNY